MASQMKYDAKDVKQRAEGFAEFAEEQKEELERQRLTVFEGKDEGPTTVHVEDLYYQLEALRDGKLLDIEEMPAEVPRQATQYALFTIKMPDKSIRRVSLLFCESKRQRPNGIEMLKRAKFFTSEETLAVFEKRILELKALPNGEEGK